MLANSPSTSTRSGALNPEVLLKYGQLYDLLDFIAEELPRWRDRSDRPSETSETILTDQLCDHLNGAAHRSPVWDILQFRTEIPDERKRGRKIDLAAKPVKATVIIEGRRHTEFDMVLPLECKRLPTPVKKGRDAREYVIDRARSSGGIQRFKLGAHGGMHRLAGMIAYVQEDTVDAWRKRVSRWIRALAKASPAWSPAECPTEVSRDDANGVAQFASNHRRTESLPDIELRHLWVLMK